MEGDKERERQRENHFSYWNTPQMLGITRGEPLACVRIRSQKLNPGFLHERQDANYWTHQYYVPTVNIHR